MPELIADPRLATNALRLRNRAELVERIWELTRRHPTQYRVDGLDAAGLPRGLVNTIDRVFE